MGNALDARSAREALIVEALRGVDTVGIFLIVSIFFKRK